MGRCVSASYRLRGRQICFINAVHIPKKSLNEKRQTKESKFTRNEEEKNRQPKEEEEREREREKENIHDSK